MTDLPPRLEVLLRRHLPLLGSDALCDDQDLAALGLDSMGSVQLLFDIEAEFGVTFPDDAVTPNTFVTPATVLAAVERARWYDDGDA